MVSCCGGLVPHLTPAECPISSGSVLAAPEVWSSETHGTSCDSVSSAVTWECPRQGTPEKSPLGLRTQEVISECKEQRSEEKGPDQGEGWAGRFTAPLAGAGPAPRSPHCNIPRSPLRGAPPRGYAQLLAASIYFHRPVWPAAGQGTRAQISAPRDAGQASAGLCGISQGGPADVPPATRASPNTEAGYGGSAGSG